MRCSSRWRCRWAGRGRPLAGGSTACDALGADAGAPEPDAARRRRTPDTAAPRPRPAPPDGPPGARLVLSVTDLDFGTVNIGAQATNVVVVTNIGDPGQRPAGGERGRRRRFPGHQQLRRPPPGHRRDLRRHGAVRPHLGRRQDDHRPGQPDRGRPQPSTFTARGTGRLAPDAGAQDAQPAGRPTRGPPRRRPTHRRTAPRRRGGPTITVRPPRRGPSRFVTAVMRVTIGPHGRPWLRLSCAVDPGRSVQTGRIGRCPVAGGRGRVRSGVATAGRPHLRCPLRRRP